MDFLKVFCILRFDFDFNFDFDFDFEFPKMEFTESSGPRLLFASNPASVQLHSTLTTGSSLPTQMFPIT